MCCAKKGRSINYLKVDHQHLTLILITKKKKTPSNKKTTAFIYYTIVLDPHNICKDEKRVI